MTSDPKEAGAQLRPRDELLAMIDGLVSAFMREPDVRAHETISALSEAAERIRANAVLSTPPSGPQGENLIGAAEVAVGQFVYRRIEKLMGAEPGSPEAAELDYLASIASDVEEYGAAGDEDGQRSPFQDDHGPEGLTPEEAWQDLIEKDDRTSPSDTPEMALITFAELRDYMQSALASPQQEANL